MTTAETGPLSSAPPALPPLERPTERPAEDRSPLRLHVTPDSSREKRQSLRLNWMAGAAPLEGHLAAWDALARQAPQQLPMLAGSWVLPHLEAMLSPADRWECLLAFDGQELVGALPLIVGTRRLFGRELHLLRSVTDPHTRSGDAVVQAGYEESALPAMLQAAVLRYPGMQSLALRGVVAGSPVLSLLDEHYRETRVLRQSAGGGSYLPVSGDAEDLHRRLTAKFRSDLRNARRKLEKMGTVGHVSITGKAAGDAEHLQTFLRLEASGWKGAMGTAIRLDPVLVRFYSELARRMAARGWLEWHFLQLDDRTIAAELTLRMGRTLSLLKMAYDETLSRCAPGNVLFLAVAEHVHAQGDTDRIDCLTDMPWHRQWKMAQREYFDLFLYPRRFLPGLAGFVAHRSYLRMKSVPLLRQMKQRFEKRMAGEGKRG